MNKRNTKISRIIAYAAVSLMCVYCSVICASAAGTPEKNADNKAFIPILAVIFAAALIFSSVMTYKLRTRSISRNKADDEQEHKEDKNGY